MTAELEASRVIEGSRRLPTTHGRFRPSALRPGHRRGTSC